MTSHRALSFRNKITGINNKVLLRIFPAYVKIPAPQNFLAKGILMVRRTQCVLTFSMVKCDTDLNLHIRERFRAHGRRPMCPNIWFGLGSRQLSDWGATTKYAHPCSHRRSFPHRPISHDPLWKSQKAGVSNSCYENISMFSGSTTKHFSIVLVWHSRKFAIYLHIPSDHLTSTYEFWNQPTVYHQKPKKISKASNMQQVINIPPSASVLRSSQKFHC